MVVMKPPQQCLTSVCCHNDHRILGRSRLHCSWQMRERPDTIATAGEPINVLASDDYPRRPGICESFSLPVSGNVPPLTPTSPLREHVNNQVAQKKTRHTGCEEGTKR